MIVKVDRFIKECRVDLNRVYLDTKEHVWRHKHNDAINERLTYMYAGWVARIKFVRKILNVDEEKGTP